MKSWFDSREVQESSLFSKATTQGFRPTQPPIQSVPEFFPGTKAAGRDVNHLPPSDAEIKNELIYTSGPQHKFMGRTGINLPSHF